MDSAGRTVGRREPEGRCQQPHGRPDQPGGRLPAVGHPIPGFRTGGRQVSLPLPGGPHQHPDQGVEDDRPRCSGEGRRRPGQELTESFPEPPDTYRPPDRCHQRRLHCSPEEEAQADQGLHRGTGRVEEQTVVLEGVQRPGHRGADPARLSLDGRGDHLGCEPPREHEGLELKRAGDDPGQTEDHLDRPCVQPGVAKRRPVRFDRHQARRPPPRGGRPRNDCEIREIRDCGNRTHLHALLRSWRATGMAPDEEP